MKAILVAIKLKSNESFDETLQECLSLTQAANIDIIETITQSSNNIDPNYGLRKGKLEELANALALAGVKQVVFYNNLSTKIISNLKDYLHVEIMDRISLILYIFSTRARSKESQIQTQIARLKYDLPQMLKENMDQDKQRGGTFNNRGAGESRNSIIKRTMESRIKQLQNELRQLENRKENEYTKRDDILLKKVALVGYTNSGKSSLMNVMLSNSDKQDKQVLEKDMLFATLDTSCRKIKHNKNEFLLFDTVGFVSDLPHELVDAFKSTLKAAVYADLLINVIDISNKNYKLHEKVTIDTLNQIGASNIPMIFVYNKVDKYEGEMNENQFYISCKDKTGIEQLFDKVIDELYPQEVNIEIFITYDKLSIISKYSHIVNFELIENREDGCLYKLSGPESILNSISKKIKEVV